MLSRSATLSRAPNCQLHQFPILELSLAKTQNNISLYLNSLQVEHFGQNLIICRKKGQQIARSRLNVDAQVNTKKDDVILIIFHTAPTYCYANKSL
jgi:hypothetical protein